MIEESEETLGPWWEGIVPQGLLDIEDKIREARHFLGLMEMAASQDEFRWRTSAFLDASRSALDWLAWSVHHGKAVYGDPDDPDSVDFVPDEKALATLERYVTVYEVKSAKGFKKVHVSPKHPLLIRMAALRRESAHRSPLWIARRRGALDGASEGQNERYEFVGLDASSELVLPFCRQVVLLVEKIQDEVRD